MSTSNTNPPISHTPSESVSGRNPLTPMNGNSSFATDHKRAPSMTVTPAGATTFNTNGPPKANVQFGSLNNGGNAPSPALSSSQLAHQSSNSLGVNNLNPRMPSPSSSPSPIAQPVQASGGRPPSDMQGPKGAMNFGQFGNDGSDVNVCIIFLRYLKDAI